MLLTADNAVDDRGILPCGSLKGDVYRVLGGGEAWLAGTFKGGQETGAD